MVHNNVTVKQGELIEAKCAAWNECAEAAGSDLSRVLKRKNPYMEGSAVTVQIKFKKVHELAKLPTKATVGSAGYDLYAVEGAYLGEPLATALISTGLQVEIPEGYEIQIRPRSGLAIKNKITVINSPGTIDADFRGIMKVALVNLSNVPFSVNPGDRIAQAVVCKLPDAEFVELNALTETDRGSGGFGSTGNT